MAETERRIRKVARYHLYLFLLPALSLLFYGWLRAPHLAERPDNPQRVAPLHQRGRILDGAGRPLAHSVKRERIYPLGRSTGPLIGYSLRGRNQTGLEAALQQQLSAPLPPTSLAAALEQDAEVAAGERPALKGPDVMLTLDGELQKALFEALGELPGAIAVADERGRLLAAVSSPSFDPETVAERWGELRSDPGAPFIERVGGGLYPVTLPDGRAIVAREESEEHPWFKAGSFSGYPTAATSALWIENRQLLSPLMLLQLAYKAAGREAPPSPTVLMESQPAPGPLSTAPLAVSPEQHGGLSLRRLRGDPFRDSPRFLPVIGHRPREIFFAVVLEQAGAEAEQALRSRILPVLQGYTGPAW